MTETVLVAIIGVAGTIIGTILGLLCSVAVENTRTKNDGKIYVSKAQDVLYENAPFIPEDIYKKFDELNNVINNQFWRYMGKLMPNGEQRLQNGEQNDITDYVEFQLREIASNVREYLSKLFIIK